MLPSLEKIRRVSLVYITCICCKFGEVEYYSSSNFNSYQKYSAHAQSSLNN